MKIALCLLVMLAACTDDPKECGPYPTPPGWTAAFESVNGQDRALLTRDDYENINAWRDDVTHWATCMEQR